MSLNNSYYMHFNCGGFVAGMSFLKLFPACKILNKTSSSTASFQIQSLFSHKTVWGIPTLLPFTAETTSSDSDDRYVEPNWLKFFFWE